MKKILLSLLFISILFNLNSQVIDNDTISNRQLSEWKSLKYGLFIHYGLYSVAAGVWNGENIPYYSEQIMNHARIPVNDYLKLGDGFTAKGWSADSIACMAKRNGMKYIVITSKHHDGFCMFHSKYSKMNVVDGTAAGRDIIAELADACKRYDIPLGFYYSLPDWSYINGIERGEPDSLTNCTTFVNQLYSPLEHINSALEDYIVNQLHELLTNYGDIYTIWFDMGILTAEQSKKFREAVKKIQPKCLVSGRIMNNYGDYLTLPDNGAVQGYTQIAWDNPASLYGTWGYRSWQVRPELDLQIEKQLNRLLKTVSYGGVFLLNIGPKGDGSVLDYEKSVLDGIGDWLKINGEAIYNTNPTSISLPQPNVYTTLKENKLYVISRNMELDSIVLPNVSLNINKVYTLEGKENVDFKVMGRDIVLKCGTNPLNNCKSVYVVEFEGELNIYPKMAESKDGVFILTNDNATIHAAFDAENYVTTQHNSYISWIMNNVPEGEYSVFVDYLPSEAANKYKFTIGDKIIKHLLPGVDKMLQRCFIGNVKIGGGDTYFEIDLADKPNKLSPLGIKVEQVIVRPCFK